MNDKSNKRAGIIGTVIFHLLLLLLFSIGGLTQPDPLPETESATIMLGWVDEGSGDTDPSPVPEENQDVVPSQSEPEPVVAQEAIQETIETQDASPVAVTKPKENTKPKEETPKKEDPIKEPEPPKPSKDLQNALDNVWDKPAGGSKGNDDKEGSEGKQDGKKEGKGVFGSGGNSWSLGDRNYLGGAIVTEKPKEEGIIVLEIIVGTNGKVIETNYSASKSTSTSMHLINLAKKAAKNAKFNNDHSASVRQKGTLTFNFKLK